MVEVIWTKRALQQLEKAITFIKEEQSPFYAKIVLEKILDSTRNLPSHPDTGTIEPLLAHKKSEYRFLVVWSYKIIYRTTKKKVVISRIFHTSRNPDKLKGV